MLKRLELSVRRPHNPHNHQSILVGIKRFVLFINRIKYCTVVKSTRKPMEINEYIKYPSVYR